MPQHALITILLTVIIGILLFVAGVGPLLTAAACLTFFGLRNDV